ncbi:helix-turn-helix domain-containing protein [Bacillus gobiensis]|uniref:helix-turn-helix domain-containing protein n=1 Tax=Bacillus gobiensis TaxID=1441095 RepID=UPI003D1CB0B1
MSVDYLDLLIMDCISAFQNERSGSAIYHLLKGKKSSQTIQDGKLFSLAKYRGLFPTISPIEFHERLLKLQRIDFIIHHEAVDSFSLTKEGIESVNTGFIKSPWPRFLHGAHYHQAARVFWSRMSLMIQVLSNYLNERRSYIPISSDHKIREWVKKHLKDQGRLDHFAEALYKELEEILLQQGEKEAEVFVYSLTSAHRVGWTHRQLANRFREDYWYIYALFWNVIHYIIQTSSKSETPILNEMLSEYSTRNFLTASSRKTLLMLKQGVTISEIAAARSLKTATIEDHVVEIAIHDPFFSIDPFLSKGELDIITTCAEKLRTNKLKRINESLNGKFSYFQIRLALTQKVNQNE